MKKKKKLILTPEERARFAETMRMLEERIAILDKKVAERKAQRGET